MMGDLPDFDSMSEEEQMRWLESLAKRQGGDERGFTTEANLEVPEVDPDTVVDEPGYTPYYSSSSSSSGASSTPPAETPPQEDAVAEPSMAEASAGEEEMAGIGDDPMAWLESLAKRQGGDERGFTTSADMEVPEVDPDSVTIDEPGYTPYGQSPAQPAAEQAPPPPAEESVVAESAPAAPLEEPPAPEAVPEAPLAEEPVSENEMTGVGDDPMAWLESLAKRQGGDERGFTTSADMEVPEIDPDSVTIDEPGYTPYGQSPAQPAAEQAPPPPVEEPVVEETAPKPVAEEPVIDEPPVPEESSQPILADGELPADIDPIKWLESLARRSPDVDARGLTNEEFYDIPEVDPDSVVIDEPGYTPSSSTATTGSTAQSAGEPEPTMAEEPELVDFDELETADMVNEDDWLTDLAAESTGDAVDDFLSEMTDDSVFELEEELDLDDETPAVASSATSIAGMSDEEIARAQAEGTITPEQELAWLQQKLTEVPDEEDFDIADLAPEDIEDAIESDVPDWLAAQMPGDDAETSEDAIQDDMMALVGQSEELDLDDLDLGDDAFDLDLDTALEDDALELALDSDEDLLEELEMPAELLAELETESPVAEGEIELGDAGNLLEGYTPEADDWGFALEQDIEIEDISSVPEPDWYTEALQKAESELDEPLEDLAVPELSLEESPITPDVVEQETTADGEALPDWLQDLEPTIEEDPSLPDWLRTDNEIEGWLLEQQSGIEEETREVPAPVFAESPVAESSVPAPTSSGIGLPTDERLDKAREGGYPSWYVPPTGEPAPAPVVQEQAPPAPKPEPVDETPAPPPPKPEPKAEPVPQPEPSAVMPAELADYVERLERNPEDHSSRLTYARHLSRANQINDSLDQYETLIKKSAELDNVSNELANLIKQLPAHPKARRLLGDVYMRQGRLQEALDTYRGALDKI